MPIDADAYMSGAIPTLSRGGSWVPAAHSSHPANGTANPNASHLPAQTQNQTQPDQSMQGGGGNMMSSWGTPMFFPGSGGSGGVAANGSVRSGGMGMGMGGVVYPGWKAAAGNGMNGPGGLASGIGVGSVVGGNGSMGGLMPGGNIVGGFTGGGMMSSGSDVGRNVAFKAMSSSGRRNPPRNTVPEVLRGGTGGAGGVGEGYDIEHGVGVTRENAGLGKTSPIAGSLENSRSRADASVAPPRSASTVFPHRRPHMAKVPSTAPAVIARDMAYHQATPSIHSASMHSPTVRPDGKTALRGQHSWEDGAGSPTLIPREPDYNSGRNPYVPVHQAKDIPVVHRKRADSLPRVPSPDTEIVWSHTPAGRRRVASKINLEGRKRNQVSVDERVRERDNGVKPGRGTLGPEGAQGPSDTVESSRNLRRRHSDESLLPAVRQDRSGRSSEPTVPLPVDISPKHQSHLPKSPPALPSPYIKLGPRPGMPRRNTHEPVSPPISESRPSTLGISSATFYSRRVRHMSSPNLAESDDNSSATSASPPVERRRLPKLSSPPSLSAPRSPSDMHRQSRYDMSAIHSALPTVTATALPERPPPRISYLPPTLHESYDRYASHPAAPAPPRADRHIVGPPLGNTALTSPSHPPPGMGGDTIILSQGGTNNPGIAHGQEYLPIGYARPLADMEWNRDGPAMKTYGVAWKRHQDGMVLPGGPQGPRWDVARPPRDSMVSSGGWWLSGGE